MEWFNYYVGIIEVEEFIFLNGYEYYSIFVIDDYKGKLFCFVCVIYFRLEGIFWYLDDGFYGLMCYENCYKLFEWDFYYMLWFCDVWLFLM